MPLSVSDKELGQALLTVMEQDCHVGSDNPDGGGIVFILR